MADLLALGLSHKEARSALLACGKDVQRAASHALEQRAAAAARRQARRKEREIKRDEARYAHATTPSGRRVEGRVVRAVMELGYPEALAVAAVARADNSVDLAVETLAQPEAYEALQLSILTSPPLLPTDEDTAVAPAGAADSTETPLPSSEGPSGGHPSASAAKKARREPQFDETEMEAIHQSGLEVSETPLVG